MKTTKWMAVLLALVVVLSMVPAVSATEAVPAGLEYTVTDDHVEITGYTGSAAELVIPAQIEGMPVTVIGRRALYHCYSLTSVTVPDSVTSIEQRAFYNCANLTSITLPNGITAIANETFGNCGKLTDITIPDSVTKIGREAFWGCQSLPEIIIPEGVTTIGDDAFAWCISLTSMTIPAGVTSIGDTIYHRCSGLTEILVDANNSAYRSIDGVLFSKDATELICHPIAKAGSAYAIPEGVATIGDYAFFACAGLNSITIPASVSEYGHQAFSSTGLTEVLVDDGNAAYCSVGGVLFSKDMSELVYYPTGSAESAYTIPDGVTAIGNWAFGSCAGLKRVIIPEGVVSIGEFAFAECVNLNSIQIPASVTIVKCNAFESGCENLSDVYYTGSEALWNEIEIEYNNDALLKATIHFNATAPIPNPFADVPADAFYHDPVLWAVANGVTNGATENTFNPDGQCQRAQVVTFLWRSAGCPEPASSVNPFVDVKESDFYYKAVLWAVEQGVTNGLDATHFGPFSDCNRAQVVTFLYRAMGQPEVSAAECPFTDVQAGGWYETPVLWAVENGVTNGMDASTFGVDTICNRAQVVTFLYRTYVN